MKVYFGEQVHLDQVSITLDSNSEEAKLGERQKSIQGGRLKEEYTFSPTFPLFVNQHGGESTQ